MALEFSYYTINDLRKGHDEKGVTGWRQDRFLDRKGALLHYRHIPDTGVKALGISDGEHDVDLIRCVPLFPGDKTGEDVLDLSFLTVFEGKEKAHAAELAGEWVRLLNVCYCLDVDRLIPAPSSANLKDLEGKYLWPNRSDDPETALRWIRVAEIGWLSPAEFKRRYPPNGDFSYPLVLKCRAEGVTESGDYCGLEVTPYEFVKLKQRTEERINRRKNKGGTTHESV